MAESGWVAVQVRTGERCGHTSTGSPCPHALQALPERRLSRVIYENLSLIFCDVKRFVLLWLCSL